MNTAHDVEFDAEAAALVTELGEALHRHGAPANRVEAAMTALSTRLGLVGSFFSTPTAIFTAFGHPPAQRAFLQRVESGDLDLGRLADLDEIANATLDGTLHAHEARARLRTVLGRPAPYHAATRILAHALVGASAAVLLGGSWREAIVALGIALLLGTTERVAMRVPSLMRIFVPALAFAAAAVATLAAHFARGLDAQVAIVAGVVVLLPGLTLTTAVSELATGHLASGSARFSQALVTFLLLGFGFALGAELVTRVGWEPAVAALPSHVPNAIVVACLLGSCLGLAINLRVRPRDMPVVFASGALAFYGARFGSELLGSALGASVAAFALGVLGNAYARFLRRPSAVPVVPGILLLVPGSMGFRSVASFLSADVVSAVSTAFEVALVAISLVTGLLVASLALPPRRAL